MLKSILLMCPVFLFASCGKHISEGGSPAVQEAAISEGAFHARLKTMNAKASGTSSGLAKMDIAGDNIVIDVDMGATQVGVTHQQFIRSGKRCPTLADDLNKDGYIDADEERKVVGDFIVALDDDLHIAEDGTFPFTNAAASYYYTEAGSLYMLNSTIKGSLKLDGRIVTVHGINKEIVLPRTVATRDGRSANVTLSIACGKIFPGLIEE